MSIIQEVRHRVRPCTASAQTRFSEYYQAMVIEKNDFLDVIAAWVYLDGDTNTDLYLYRYPSISAIEASFAKFGSSEEFQHASQALFQEIELEESREIRAATAYSSPGGLEQLMQQRPQCARYYVQLERQLPQQNRDAAHSLAAQLIEAREKAGSAQLALACETIIGPVERATEYWVLPEGSREFETTDVDEKLLEEMSKLAPEVSRRYLKPLPISRLR